MAQDRELQRDRPAMRSGFLADRRATHDSRRFVEVTTQNRLLDDRAKIDNWIDPEPELLVHLVQVCAGAGARDCGPNLHMDSPKPRSVNWTGLTEVGARGVGQFVAQRVEIVGERAEADGASGCSEVALLPAPVSHDADGRRIEVLAPPFAGAELVGHLPQSFDQLLLDQDGQFGGKILSRVHLTLSIVPSHGDNWAPPPRTPREPPVRSAFIPAAWS